MKESFESLNEYTSDNYKILVNESLLLEKDEESGIFGKIIDRGLSFVPRSMRFKKAKKTMGKALGLFTKKSKNLIDKFADGFTDKVKTIDESYKKMMSDQIEPLIKEGKNEQVLKLLENQKKEIEQYRKEQLTSLDKGIDDILAPYTNSLEKRIDSPGFVLNVELSEKGKGELRAKWQELAAIQKIEIDKHKTKLIKSKGYSRLDEIIAEITASMEDLKYKEKIKNLDLSVQSIEKKQNNVYLVKVHFRTSGARLNVQEKGLIISDDPNKLKYSSGANVVKSTGTHEFTANTWQSFIKDVTGETYVRPYVIDKNAKHPILGDVVQIKSMETSGDKDKQKIVGKRSSSDSKDAGGELSGEEFDIQNP